MTKFRFDASKSLEENFDLFLDELQSRDPEMAKILQDNWNTLTSITIDGQRNPNYRTKFNESVLLALEAQMPSDISPDDG